jgi:hypothetical protein
MIQSLQNLQNNPILNKDIVSLVVYDLQPKTKDYSNILFDSLLGKMPKPSGELTSQEKSDVKEYFSSSEKPKIFHNVKELLNDLHE